MTDNVVQLVKSKEYIDANPNERKEMRRVFFDANLREKIPEGDRYDKWLEFNDYLQKQELLWEQKETKGVATDPTFIDVLKNRVDRSWSGDVMRAVMPKTMGPKPPEVISPSWYKNMFGVGVDTLTQSVPIMVSGGIAGLYGLGSAAATAVGGALSGVFKETMRKAANPEERRGLIKDWTDIINSGASEATMMAVLGKVGELPKLRAAIQSPLGKRVDVDILGQPFERGVLKSPIKLVRDEVAAFRGATGEGFSKPGYKAVKSVLGGRIGALRAGIAPTVPVPAGTPVEIASLEALNVIYRGKLPDEHELKADFENIIAAIVSMRAVGYGYKVGKRMNELKQGFPKAVLDKMPEAIRHRFESDDAFRERVFRATDLLEANSLFRDRLEEVKKHAGDLDLKEKKSILKMVKRKLRLTPEEEKKLLESTDFRNNVESLLKVDWTKRNLSDVEPPPYDITPKSGDYIYDLPGWKYIELPYKDVREMYYKKEKKTTGLTPFAMADHESKTIYMASNMASADMSDPLSRKWLFEHEKHHVKFAQDDSQYGVGEAIYKAYRDAVDRKLKIKDIMNEGAISPYTYKRLKVYEKEGGVNEADLIEEAYATEMAYQDLQNYKAKQKVDKKAEIKSSVTKKIQADAEKELGKKFDDERNYDKVVQEIQAFEAKVRDEVAKKTGANIGSFEEIPKKDLDKYWKKYKKLLEKLQEAELYYVINDKPIPIAQLSRMQYRQMEAGRDMSEMTGKMVIRKVGSDNPKDIIAYYSEKYKDKLTKWVATDIPDPTKHRVRMATLNPSGESVTYTDVTNITPGMLGTSSWFEEYRPVKVNVILVDANSEGLARTAAAMEPFGDAISSLQRISPTSAAFAATTKRIWSVKKMRNLYGTKGNRLLAHGDTRLFVPMQDPPRILAQRLRHEFQHILDHAQAGFSPEFDSNAPGGHFYNIGFKRRMEKDYMGAELVKEAMAKDLPFNYELVEEFFMLPQMNEYILGKLKRGIPVDVTLIKKRDQHQENWRQPHEVLTFQGQAAMPGIEPGGGRRFTHGILEPYDIKRVYYENVPTWKMTTEQMQYVYRGMSFPDKSWGYKIEDFYVPTNSKTYGMRAIADLDLVASGKLRSSLFPLGSIAPSEPLGAMRHQQFVKKATDLGLQLQEVKGTLVAYNDIDALKDIQIALGTRPDYADLNGQKTYTIDQRPDGTTVQRPLTPEETTANKALADELRMLRGFPYHKQSVELKLARNQFISDEVVQEYPDLVEKYRPVLKEQLATRNKMTTEIDVDTVDQFKLNQNLRNQGVPADPINHLKAQYGDMATEFMDFQAADLTLFGRPRPPRKPPSGVGFNRPPGRPERFTDLPPEERFKAEQALSEAEIMERSRTRISDAIDYIGKVMVDPRFAIRKALSKQGNDHAMAAIRRIDLARGAEGESLRWINTYSNAIFFNDNSMNKLLGYYLSARDTAERGATVKTRWTPEEANAWLKRLESHTEVFRALDERARWYWHCGKNCLDLMLEEGVLNQERYDALRSQHTYYSPRLFVQYLDSPVTYTYRGKSISVGKLTGLPKVEEGAYDAMEVDPRFLLQHMVTRTMSAVFKNRANVELYNFAQSVPDNPVVREIPNTSDDISKIHGDYAPIRVMVGGEEKILVMPKDWAAEWVMNDHAMDSALVVGLGILTGVKVKKALVTRYNPEFSAFNLIRDASYIYASTKEYSTSPFRFWGEYKEDLRATWRDALFKQGSYIDASQQGLIKEYVKGMSQTGYTWDWGTKSILNVLEKMGERVDEATVSKIRSLSRDFADGLSFLSEFSEIWSRLALRRRAIMNGKSAEEANYIAATYIDFTNGGPWAKALDNICLPFFNAGIQGARGIVRTVKEDPADFMARAAWITGTSAAIYMIRNMYHPGFDDNLSKDPDRQNALMEIPTFMSYVDVHKQEIPISFSIPVEQNIRIFKAIGEYAARKVMGHPDNMEQIIKAAGDFFALPQTYLPPTLEAIMRYQSNYDPRSGKPIFAPAARVSIEPKEQYYPGWTPNAYIGIGEVLNMSPALLQDFTKTLFGRNNTYLWGAGIAIDFMIKDSVPEPERKVMIEETLTRAPFLRRFLRPVYPLGTEGSTAKERKMKSDTEAFKIRREIDRLAISYANDQSEDRSKWKMQAYEFVNKQKPENRKMYWRRFENQMALRELPDRQYWLDLLDLDPEDRADEFVDRFFKVSEDKQKEMLYISRFKLRKLGFWTPRFTKQYRRRLLDIRRDKGERIPMTKPLEMLIRQPYEIEGEEEE